MDTTSTTMVMLDNGHLVAMLSPYYYLGTDIGIVLLQLMSITGNAFIVFCFYVNPKLGKNTALGLNLAMAVTDFLFAISTIPYVANYLAGWSATKQFDYDGQRVVLLSLPLTIHFKLNLCVSTAIALDRLQAMRWPMYYRNKSQRQYVFGTLIVGLVLSSIDVAVEFLFGIKKQSIGCAAVGCFTSHTFLQYWGASNTLLNIIMFLVSMAVVYEFNKFWHHITQAPGIAPQQQSTQVWQITLAEKSAAAKERKSFQQVNIISLGLLLLTMIFQLIPSTAIFVFDALGFDAFFYAGPFYIVGLLAAGALNSFIYILFHSDFRSVAANCARCRFSSLKNLGTSTGVHGTTQPTHLPGNSSSYALRRNSSIKMNNHSHTHQQNALNHQNGNGAHPGPSSQFPIAIVSQGPTTIEKTSKKVIITTAPNGHLTTLETP